MNKEVSNLLDTAGIFRYHKALIEKYGEGTIGAIGWHPVEGQQVRFGKLSEIGDMNERSVLDAGCGYADMFPFLQSRYPALTYHGCEQIPELLNTAACRYKGRQGITLWLGNFLHESLPVTDYVLVSGSLNYRHHEADFIFKAIQTLFAHCRFGLAFNLLSGGTMPDTLLVSYNPQEIVQFCYTLSPRVQLHEGYWNNDFTIFMYKQ